MAEILFISTAVPQTVIRERIVLGKMPPMIAGTAEEGGSQAFLVAQVPGRLTVKVVEVTELGTPIPPDARVEVRYRQQTRNLPLQSYASDTSTGTLGVWIPAQDTVRDTLWYQRVFMEGVDSVGVLPSVCVGDTLWFTYHGSIDLDSGSVSQSPYGDGSVQLGQRSTEMYHPFFPHAPYDRATCAIELTLEPEYTILLGETKYYSVEYNAYTESGLLFRESVTPQTGEVYWGANPVTIATGDKLGVYWERKDADGDRLDTTAIRLVGRYWTNDSSHSVRLRISNGTLSDSVLIRILRPDSLGESDSWPKDVYDHTTNLDSIVFCYAGRTGIPPQIIKAVISKESSFIPQWRYEPFKDAQLQDDPQQKSRMSGNSYWVSEASNGTPLPPLDHHFKKWGLWATSYMPVYQGSVYDVVIARIEGSPPTYLGTAYPELKTAWSRSPSLSADSVARIFPPPRKAIRDSIAGALRPEMFRLYLRDSTHGGLAVRPAQTRIVGSYGFMQMMYYDAFCERSYHGGGPSNPRMPELLMVTDTNLTRCTQHLISKFGLRKVGRQSFSATGAWSQGLEQTYVLALTAYNGWKKDGSLSYGVDVLNRSKSYLPRKRVGQ